MERPVRQFIDAARLAIKHENWYGALALALTMPDICGRISYPKLAKRSEDRYVLWFDTYLAAQYQGGWNNEQFLTGGDMYALRCAFLHQGEFDVTDQKARQALERFHLTAPFAGVMHNNRSMNMDDDGKIKNCVLQLSVDIFCEDVCTGVEKWMADNATDTRISAEIQQLGAIHAGGSF